MDDRIARVSSLLTALVMALALLPFAGGPVEAISQDPAARAAEILEMLPAANERQRAELKRALTQLAAGEIEEICRGLVVPGTGDDTRRRGVLHALALIAAEPGAERLRGELVDAVTRLLRSDIDRSVKAFLLQQLRFAAAPDEAAAVAAFLHDEDLCAPACAILVTTGGEGARRALREALAGATAPSRVATVAIIDALGILRDRDSVPRLLEEAESDDRDIRLASLAALAEIGDAAAIDTLMRAAAVEEWQERSRVTALALRLAQRLAAGGDREPATGIYRSLMETRSPSESAHVHAAALRGLAEALGAAAVMEVVAALTDESAEMRAAALEIAVALEGTGTTSALIRAMEGASAPARASLLAALGRRGDAAALAAARAALEDTATEVRVAAVVAVAALGGEGEIGTLIAFLDGAHAAEGETAQRALVRMPGGSASGIIATAIDGAPPAIRIDLLEVLSRRHAVGELETITAALEDGEGLVRVAAARALGELAGVAVVPPLLLGLGKATGSEERKALEGALAAVCLRAGDPERRSAPILTALREERLDEYCSLLRVLGKIGGAPAFGAVRAALDDPRDDARDAAFAALGEWPDPGPADEMLGFARSVEGMRDHVRALRAFARLVSLDERGGPLAQVARLDAGMGIARRQEERKLLLSRMGEIPDARALAVLEPYLSHATLAAEGAAAMIRAAEGMLPARARPARLGLEKVIAATTPQSALRQRAEELFRRAAEYDFITDWRVAGPYTREGVGGNDLIDLPFPPEQPGSREVEWKVQPITEDPARYWFADLIRSVGGNNRVAYLSTRIFSPAAQPVRLEIGSDDGIKVWLNDEVVHVNKVPRGCSPGDDTVEATLRQGWNDVLVKVANLGGGWGACLRVRSAKGERLEGVYAEARR